MNRLCPVCRADLLETDECVPYEDNDKLFTLQFCSANCRDEYKDNE